MSTGEHYFWWNDTQRQLSNEVAAFAASNIVPRIQECEDSKRFPWEILDEIGKKGWYGVLIPKEHGGMGDEFGVTGMCIILEEVARGAAIAVDFYETTIYGYSPIVRFGTEAQKQKWLPPLATGEHFACIAITEPFMGSDAASIQTKMIADGDEFVINGKKRFITVGGVGTLYCTYVQTSDDPEDIRNYRHLSVVLVEKGAPGFSVEQIHDPMGRFGSRHAVLDYDNVRVPKSHLIGEIGDGWKILMDALNIERLGVAAGAIGVSRACMEATADYTTRRVAFKKTLSEIDGVQVMGADMVISTSLMSLSTYHAAYHLDQGTPIPLGASLAKFYATDRLTKVALDAIQCHGGDGYMRNYTPERQLRDSKLIEIGAGANEVLQHQIWKQWLKVYRKERQASMTPARETAVTGAEAESAILKSLGDFYNQHPALYMETEELSESAGIVMTDIDAYLVRLEEQDLVALYRSRGRISLVKASYAGLKKAYPLEHYKQFPEFVDMEKEVF
jgi:alkylation response protein AidB-like acyl-CoA dehydrogenase